MTPRTRVRTEPDAPTAPAPSAESIAEKQAEEARHAFEQGMAEPSAQDALQDSEPPTEVPAGEQNVQEPSQEPSAEEPLSVESEPLQDPSGEALPVAGANEDATSFRDWLHGSLAVRYRGRTNGDDDDHDLGGLLAVDVANPAAPWISGHLQARVDADLDGSNVNDVFGSLADTYDSDVVGKLYLAFADIALSKRVEDSPGTLRVGRQSDPRLPEVLRLDGVSYVSRPLGEHGIELGAYGGVPVHLYESSREGDRAFGTFAEGEPWKDGRLRLDWMHLEDEQVLGEGEDDLLALGLWQRLAERWNLEGEYTHLEGDPRDLRLRALYGNADSDTTVRVGYYELLETQRALVTELDPFFEQLLDYFPFRQTTFNVSQGFGEHTVVDVGIDFRRVSDSSDVGEFNRDWERYYATGTYNDLGTEGLALSLTVDRWDDDDRDTSSIGADLSYAPDDRWDASIGTYYSLYKYQFLELDEQDNVRTYYVRTSYDLTNALQLDLLYEFEDDDFDTYHTLRLGSQWQF